MGNRAPFAPQEWYHCFNRGVDKRRVFQNERDYERFLLLMYVANDTESVHLSNVKPNDLATVLSDKNAKKRELLVDIGSYCLMPNHVHIVLKEIEPGGISQFMQKIFTGYTMYFNKRYERTGALFAGTFKSKHVYDDRYFKKVVSYVHLNPLELFDKHWQKHTANTERFETYLSAYRYSSLLDMQGTERLQGKILGASIATMFDNVPTVKEMIEELQEEDIKVKP